jgi:hypothetical protein
LIPRSDIPDTLSGIRALTSLDVSHNDVGQLVLPEGWSENQGLYGGIDGYKHTDGREQNENPGKPEGIIAIANVIPDMGVLASLNLADNRLCGIWTEYAPPDNPYDASGMFSVALFF